MGSEGSDALETLCPACTKAEQHLLNKHHISTYCAQSATRATLSVRGFYAQDTSKVAGVKDKFTTLESAGWEVTLQPHRHTCEGKVEPCRGGETESWGTDHHEGRP